MFRCPFFVSVLLNTAQNCPNEDVTWTLPYKAYCTKAASFKHATSQFYLFTFWNMRVLSPNDSDKNIQVIDIHAVIFDLDGTLLDTESLSCLAVIDSFELSNLPIPPEKRTELKSQGELLPWELKRRILGLRGSEWIPIVLGYAQQHWGVDMALDWREGWQSRCRITDSEEVARKEIVDQFWRAWEMRLGDLCEQIEACPGATDLVESLASLRFPLAIATSSRMASVQKKRCRHEGMFQSFQDIITGDDKNVKCGKPAPDIFLEAAKRLGVHPSNCLVFEDSLIGAQSAKSAGCHVVVVPDRRMEKRVFYNVADEVLTSMREFTGKKWGISLDVNQIKYEVETH